MAGRVRRCVYINCSKPLPVTSRSDKQFCDRKCKIAHLRWRRHRLEAVAIGLWFTLGRETEDVVRCPVFASVTPLSRPTPQNPAGAR
ncbi:hypothetical protein [Streptomyces mirabilis]|uniref:hypothetical protein n=1 Tax=Streptomyces mirabilis TaxID=68239 RepID=UPI00365116B6